MKPKSREQLQKSLDAIRLRQREVMEFIDSKISNIEDERHRRMMPLFDKENAILRELLKRYPWK